MSFNPDAFLQHGILGAFVLVLLFGITTTFRLISRLIDTLQHNSKEQVSALLSVEQAVKDSVLRADQRHSAMLNAFMENTRLLLDTREYVRTWITLSRKQRNGSGSESES